MVGVLGLKVITAKKKPYPVCGHGFYDEKAAALS
jgi:hypothetical protein